MPESVNSAYLAPCVASLASIGQGIALLLGRGDEPAPIYLKFDSRHILICPFNEQILLVLLIRPNAKLMIDCKQIIGMPEGVPAHGPADGPRRYFEGEAEIDGGY